MFGGAGLAPPVVKPMFGGVFTSNAEDGEDACGGGNENPEEYEPQVDFKPIVKLQEVDVRTGEEDEEALFKQRCKLYRFESATGEWKEKGVGEMKLLSHNQNAGVYRLLMRRDQVLKLCANHRITADLKFEIYNEKQVRWHAEDYSEVSGGKHETLAARFKSEADARKFKEECERAQSALASALASGVVPKKQEPKPAAASAEGKDLCQGLKPSLSDLFKKSGGAWSCTQCLVQNAESAVQCAACKASKDGQLNFLFQV
jgi:E3 SUMO-protein ligase RanBP2